MSWKSLFYWFVVADNAKSLFVVFTTIFTAISLIATICFFFSFDPSSVSDSVKFRNLSRKWMFWSYPFMVLFWFLYIFTPSKKDALLIVAGSGLAEFLTTDSSAKQIPKELSSFVVSELKTMSKEAKVELGLQDVKDKYMDEANKMSVPELLRKMNTDTTFAKVVLGKD